MKEYIVQANEEGLLICIKADGVIYDSKTIMFYRDGEKSLVAQFYIEHIVGYWIKEIEEDINNTTPLI